jgi:hypothetical protein
VAPRPHGRAPAHRRSRRCNLLFTGEANMRVEDQQYRAFAVPARTLCSLAVAAALGAAPAAHGVEFSTGELTGSFDTTVSFGVASRVQDREPEHIGIVNGGDAFSVNFDDGNLNYDTGIFSSIFKVTHELELNYGNLSSFTRVYYFYDFENEDGERERTPLSDDALDLVGSDIRILDAYVSGQFDAGDKPLTLRAGDQVVSWGESTFIPNGINVINPVDVSQLRTPGAELRQAFLPVTMLWGSMGMSPNVSLEAFYQLDWEAVTADPAGTYFSSNDFASDGASQLYLGSGFLPDTTIAPDGTIVPVPPGTGVNGPIGYVVPRGPNREPDNEGQYGLAVRLFAPALNDSEFGFYFVNYHSRLPLISAVTGTPAGAGAGDYAATARYFVEYPEDIKLYGLSFNTDFGDTGISLQGDLAYRQDVPLQVDDVELLIAALSPLNPALAGLTQLTDVPFGFGQEIQGYRRLDVTQIQSTATKAFGPMLGADQWIFVSEIGATFVHDMPDKSELRFDGPGTYSSGDSLATLAGLQPAHQTNGFADEFSMGYRLLARFDYNNAVGPVNFSPRLAFSHDVAGTTPLPLGNFVEGRKALTLGVEASYQNTWSIDFSYTSFFDAEEFNQIHDRDFVALTVKWSR